MVTTPALAASASPGAGRIAFYGDMGNIINSRNPLLVRPTALLLTEERTKRMGKSEADGSRRKKIPAVPWLYI
jgi:hypothetical protein